MAWVHSPFTSGVCLECVIVKFGKKMGDKVSSKERKLPTISACGMAAWWSLEVVNETLELENELLLVIQKGVQTGPRRGSLRSSLIGFIGATPKTWFGGGGDGSVNSCYHLRFLPGTDPYSCLKPKFRRTYSNEKRRGWKVVGGSADLPLLRSPQRKSKFLPLAMVIVTVKTKRCAKNEEYKLSPEGWVRVGQAPLVIQLSGGLQLL